MEKKIVAYSLLAHINNQIPNNASHENIFIPLVKRGISKLCSKGQFKGDDIADISSALDELYDLNMPRAVLKRILGKIENEINQDGVERLKFYADGSFRISNYVFDDYEEVIHKREEDLIKIETVYKEFLKAESIEMNPNSIFSFVEQSKASLGKYISKKYAVDHSDQTIEAKFVNFIKPIKNLYNALQSIYIGSIISIYLEYEPTGIKRQVELVLDTNFVISLLDLNTSSSTDNCRRLIMIGEKMGYKFSLLSITLKEIDQLLKNRIDNFDHSFLSKLVDPEDIYNACERRNLTKTDLDRIRVNVEKDIDKFNIVIVPNVTKYENLAKNGEEYVRLKEKRNTSFAALHDATCIEYVRAKRGKKIYDYDKVNCWILNNSSSRAYQHHNGAQPDFIKTEDLLNLLWLAHPMIKNSMGSRDFASVGLSRLVATTLDDSLPNYAKIKELDDNIKKYAEDDITHEDVLRVAKGIASRTVIKLEKLNETADKDNKAFVLALQKIADSQKEKEEGLTSLLNTLAEDFKTKILDLQGEVTKIEREREKHTVILSDSKTKYEDSINTNADLVAYNKKLKRDLIDIQNKERETKRIEFIRKAKKKWRLKSCLEVAVLLTLAVGLYLAYAGINNWDFTAITDKAKVGNVGALTTGIISILAIIAGAFVIPSLRDKYRNLSIIEKFEQRLPMPDHCKPLPYEN